MVGHCSESGLSVKLFADDTNLFIFSDSIDILKSDATNNVTLIHNWFLRSTPLA